MRHSTSLRIVLLSTQPAWHGGEAQAELLAVGLRERGHHVYILARQGTPFPDRMSGQGFDTSTFAGRGRNPCGLWQIRRQLKRIRPDVLFFNDPHSLTAGTLATVGMHVPVRLAARRVDFTIRSPWRYLRGADRVICVSQAVSAVCRTGGIPEAMLRVVHDGVDPLRIAPGNRCKGRASLGLAEHEQLLLTVAKLTDHKGHLYLLRALPAILSVHPEAVAAFAGDGELRESLEAEAVRLGIDQRVRFLGFRQDIPDLLQAADLVVAPSHLEGLNTSIIDAMLAARPIVTTTAGGIPDLVEAHQPAVGPNAWVVSPKDSDALSKTILQVLTQPEVAREFAEKARQRALAHFTSDRMVTGTLAVIDEVLQERALQAA